MTFDIAQMCLFLSEKLLKQFGFFFFSTNSNKTIFQNNTHSIRVCLLSLAQKSLGTRFACDWISKQFFFCFRLNKIHSWFLQKSHSLASIWTTFLFHWDRVTTKSKYFRVLDRTKHMCDDKRSSNEWKMQLSYTNARTALVSLECRCFVFAVRSFAFLFLCSVRLCCARTSHEAMHVFVAPFQYSTYSKHNIRLELILP